MAKHDITAQKGIGSMSDDATENNGVSSDPSTGQDAEGSGAVTPSGPVARRGEPRSFVRRYRVLLSLAVVLAIVAGSAGGYLYWLNHQIAAIASVEAGIEPDPAKNGGGEKNQPLNILLLGADNGGEAESVEADLKDGKWTPFAHRSDTMMIAHIPADRKSVQLVSIPRDTWVPIEHYPYAGGSAKINAAFAYGGPATAIDTVESLTGIAIDHLAIIDWAGFKDLTSALGGVRVYVKESFYDASQRITWEQGWQTLEGDRALQYVRTRYGLEEGDFDRIARQQNFMRATMGKLLSQTNNIFAMTKVVNTVSKYLTIDETWDSGEIRNLALSMIGISSADVQFLTAPLGKYDTSPDGQSIVRLAKKQSERLFTDLDNDSIQDYLDRYPDELLGKNRAIE